MTNFDDLKLAVQAISGGRNTVLLDDMGMPSIMVPFPKLTYADIMTGGTQDPLPAFLVDGHEIPVIYESKYQNIVVNDRAYSLPFEDPRVYITFDQALQMCRNKGDGWNSKLVLSEQDRPPRQRELRQRLQQPARTRRCNLYIRKRRENLRRQNRDGERPGNVVSQLRFFRHCRSLRQYLGVGGRFAYGERRNSDYPLRKQHESRLQHERDQHRMESDHAERDAGCAGNRRNPEI